MHIHMSIGAIFCFSSFFVWLALVPSCPSPSSSWQLRRRSICPAFAHLIMGAFGAKYPLQRAAEKGAHPIAVSIEYLFCTSHFAPAHFHPIFAFFLPFRNSFLLSAFPFYLLPTTYYPSPLASASCSFFLFNSTFPFTLFLPSLSSIFLYYAFCPPNALRSTRLSLSLQSATTKVGSQCCRRSCEKTANTSREDQAWREQRWKER
mmetsp:Transcript_561/g.1176  ORF Transcript_561/g.1176 Transcript_561/m.1176 type:complete len:205 (+) Transcript_561:669-1283(+)